MGGATDFKVGGTKQDSRAERAEKIFLYPPLFQMWGVQASKYKLLCPRGTQTCALAVANIKVNGNGKVILDTHPESDQHQN